VPASTAGIPVRGSGQKPNAAHGVQEGVPPAAHQTEQCPLGPIALVGFGAHTRIAWMLDTP